MLYGVCVYILATASSAKGGHGVEDERRLKDAAAAGKGFEVFLF